MVAVAVQLLATAGYASVMVAAATADAREGMLSFAAMVIGTPLVLISATGLTLLLVPRSARHCVGPVPSTSGGVVG
ncbi:hypothetical protein [Phytohabitans houttuyneae]|uniref:Uncharacterized protein n=1 Tax=Phytohabitans houttuyneae TaxID=1076126 RepID=A0A6V8KCE4_9ACTN|nr:hypothetical protein [Phytohabitans houttuyneae]GFJ81444.1 hypothetical protein Phou_056240 [Phytohabitans houttuyneae]